VSPEKSTLLFEAFPFVTNPLIKYISQRALQAIPLLFWVVVINFLLIHLAPGDPVSFIAGEYEATPEYLDSVRKEFGLDKPLVTQLGLYLWKVIQGDLGYSMRFRQPVLDLILSRAPATFLLIGTGLMLSTVVGLFLGIVFTRRSNTSENLAVTIAIAGHSMPAFWLGQILLIVFSLQLGLFPSQGMTSVRVQKTGFAAALDVLHHLVLPALTYATYHLTLIFRLTRSKMLETLAQDFIITARGKGLDRRTILYRHVLPNVLIPVVTVLGVNVGFMLAGSVLVETVFGWPGMGRLMYDAILARDYPVLLGLFIVISTMVIIANLLTDIVYALIDPRVAYS
jgi:ABC-type dipeptide/oligopeptide/nickel transport system permease component